MKKTIRSTCERLIVLLLVLSSVFPAARAEDGYVQDGALYYEITDGKAAVIECDTAADGSVVIPASVGGCPVTSIGEQAFSSCTNLTGITIPDSVTDIGEQAFYGCTSLTAFTVGANNPAYTADENGALYTKDKTVLLQYPTGHTRTAFTVPDCVTAVGAYAFAYARKLQSVSLSERVTALGDYAFYYCSGLTEMTLPDSVTAIGSSAFEVCTKLSAVTIGSGVTTIGDRAFRLCKELKTITVGADNPAFTAEANVLYSKDKTVLAQYPAGDLRTSFTIPDGVTNVGTYAFGYAENLQSVTVPDGLTQFGESAFYHCTKLESINLPDSVTLIGGDAFRECERLTDVRLPDSLTSIGYYAFYGCASLEQILIPDAVTHVGYQAFYGCTSLAFAHVPSTIEYMDWRVFDNCPNLAFVCSDTADCYAKTYAAENGLPYHVCGGRHPVIAPHHPDSLLDVNAEYETGAFHGEVFVLAERVAFEELAYLYPDYEAALTCNPRETLRDAYLIRVVDETGGDAALNGGQNATLFLPVPEDGDPKKSRVCHILDDTGAQIDSYKRSPKPDSADKAFTVTEDSRYFIIEVDRFGAFVMVEETIDPTVSINGFTEYRKEGYKTTLHFSASTTLPPDGSTIHWFINGINSGEGESFTVRRAKANYTVQVKLIDEDGVTVLAESETEHVTIQTGFWARLLAFFRMLVFRLPNITQK